VALEERRGRRPEPGQPDERAGMVAPKKVEEELEEALVVVMELATVAEVVEEGAGIGCCPGWGWRWC
jgi:hypothetical protein